LGKPEALRFLSPSLVGGCAALRKTFGEVVFAAAAGMMPATRTGTALLKSVPGLKD